MLLYLVMAALYVVFDPEIAVLHVVLWHFYWFLSHSMLLCYQFPVNLPLGAWWMYTFTCIKVKDTLTYLPLDNVAAKFVIWKYLSEKGLWSTHLSLQWCHNGHSGISNHQPHDCLLKCLFRCKSKKTSKFHVTCLCVGNSPVAGEFPTQMAQ